MNIRLGFARLARVTAVVYLAAAMFSIGVVAVDEWQKHRRATTGLTEYEVTAGGRTFRVMDREEYDAAERGARYAAEHPMANEPAVPLDSGLTLWPKPPAVSEGVREVGSHAALWLAVYLGLMFAFRGIRWIALGFMDPAKGEQP